MAWGFMHEVGRKTIHITILVVLWFYFFIQDSLHFSKQMALLFLVAILLFFLVLEYFRLELEWKMPFFSQFIRQKEQHRMYGVIYFLSATVIALAVFNTGIALAALFMTTFGDMAAALVGKKYGSTLIYRNKTWAGFMAELIVNLIVGFAVLSGLFTPILNFFGFSVTGSVPAAVYIVISMAFVATIVETLVDELDDNLLIPLFAGFAGQLILLSLL